MQGWIERRMNAEASALPESILEPTALEEAIARLGPVPEAAAVAPPARQRRDILDGVLASKVVRAFLANRLQTSFSLAMNLSRREPAARALLLDAMAAALMAGGGRPRAMTSDLLANIGAPEDAGRHLSDAMARPRPLNEMLVAVETAALQADAYALSVLALPLPGAAETAYLDYLAARFRLPAETVRGIRRRFQR